MVRTEDEIVKSGEAAYSNTLFIPVCDMYATIEETQINTTEINLIQRSPELDCILRALEGCGVCHLCR